MIWVCNKTKITCPQIPLAPCISFLKDLIKRWHYKKIILRVVKENQKENKHTTAIPYNPIQLFVTGFVNYFYRHFSTGLDDDEKNIEKMVSIIS